MIEERLLYTSIMYFESCYILSELNDLILQFLFYHLPSKDMNSTQNLQILLFHLVIVDRVANYSLHNYILQSIEIYIKSNKKISWIYYFAIKLGNWINSVKDGLLCLWEGMDRISDRPGRNRPYIKFRVLLLCPTYLISGLPDI